MILLKNNYYEEDEKLFSTGDSELDDILEEVYYSGIEDGYDYAQREFSDKKDTNKAEKAALATAGGLGLTAGGLKIGSILSGKASERYGKKARALGIDIMNQEAIAQSLQNSQGINAETKKLWDQVAKLDKEAGNLSTKQNKLLNRSTKLSKMAKRVAIPAAVAAAAYGGMKLINNKKEK